jgi:hypothetical protein
MEHRNINTCNVLTIHLFNLTFYVQALQRRAKYNSAPTYEYGNKLMHKAITDSTVRNGKQKRQF